PAGELGRGRRAHPRRDPGGLQAADRLPGHRHRARLRGRARPDVVPAAVRDPRRRRGRGLRDGRGRARVGQPRDGPPGAAPGRPPRRSRRPMSAYTLDTLRDFVGRELGVSGWVTVDQDRIDRFAEVTGDRQWIHVDTERARRESPHGTTIAHGLLTLSLLPALRAEVGVVPDGVARVVNYGYDRIRFLSPVRSGARIRARVVLS